MTRYGDAERGWMEATAGPAMLDTETSDASRTRVLLISNAPSIAARLTRALRALHMQSAWIRHGAKGLADARDHSFDLLMVDLELPDMSGLDVLRALRAEGEAPRCLVLSSGPSISTALSAVMPGALDMIEEPFCVSDVITAVNTALNMPTREHATGYSGPHAPGDRDPAAARAIRASQGSVTQRWASYVLNVIDADADPKTVVSWARSVGVSRSVLYECCRLVHVTPHDARDFARLVRAICRSGRAWEPESVLDVADTRTLNKLLASAGLVKRSKITPPLREFLARQQWIPQENPGLIALQQVLVGAHRPYSDEPA